MNTYSLYILLILLFSILFKYLIFKYPALQTPNKYFYLVFNFQTMNINHKVHKVLRNKNSALIDVLMKLLIIL